MYYAKKWTCRHGCVREQKNNDATIDVSKGCGVLAACRKSVGPRPTVVRIHLSPPSRTLPDCGQNRPNPAFFCRNPVVCGGLCEEARKASCRVPDREGQVPDSQNHLPDTATVLLGPIRNLASGSKKAPAILALPPRLLPKTHPVSTAMLLTELLEQRRPS